MPSAYENKTVNIALEVLRAIVPSSLLKGDDKALRLALRVIRAHIRDNLAVIEFWQIATNPHKPIYQTCIQPYNGIVMGLKRAGLTISAANDYT